MQILAITALIFFAAALVLLLSICFYKPDKNLMSAAVLHPDVQNEQNENTETSVYWKHRLDFFVKANPDIIQYFQYEALSAGFVLHYRGPRQGDDTKLFTMHDKSHLSLLTMALKKMMDEHVQPVSEFYVLFTDKNPVNAAESFLQYTESHHLHFSSCLSDFDGIHLMQKKNYAWIGTVMPAGIKLQYTDPQNELHEITKMNQFSTSGLLAMKDILPWRLYRQIRFSLTQEKGIENFTSLYPYFRERLFNTASKSEKYIYLKAQDNDGIETLLTDLQNHTDTHKAKLYAEKQLSAGFEADERCVTSALHKSFENVRTISVMIDDDSERCLLPYIDSYISFCPDGNEYIAHNGAVMFYYYFLEGDTDI